MSCAQISWSVMPFSTVGKADGAPTCSVRTVWDSFKWVMSRA